MSDVFRAIHRELSSIELLMVQTIKSRAGELLEYIELNCSTCREASIAKTKLEEAVMWAIKAATRDK